MLNVPDSVSHLALLQELKQRADRDGSEMSNSPLKALWKELYSAHYRLQDRTLLNLERCFRKKRAS